MPFGFGSSGKATSARKDILRKVEAKVNFNRCLAMASLNEQAGRHEESARLFIEAMYWEYQLKEHT